MNMALQIQDCRININHVKCGLPGWGWTRPALEFHLFSQHTTAALVEGWGNRETTRGPQRLKAAHETAIKEFNANATHRLPAKRSHHISAGGSPVGFTDADNPDRDGKATCSMQYTCAARHASGLGKSGKYRPRRGTRSITRLLRSGRRWNPYKGHININHLQQSHDHKAPLLGQLEKCSLL
jgi:hypothetical protein